MKEWLAQNPPAPELRDEGGMSPLHWAADRGSVAAVAALLDQGWHVDGRDGDGQTALHYASACEHDEVGHLKLGLGKLIARSPSPGVP